MCFTGRNQVARASHWPFALSLSLWSDKRSIWRFCMTWAKSRSLSLTIGRSGCLGVQTPLPLQIRNDCHSADSHHHRRTSSVTSERICLASTVLEFFKTKFEWKMTVRKNPVCNTQNELVRFKDQSDNSVQGRTLCLALYVPYVQYLYKPTGCTKFLWLDFIFH